MRKIHMKNHRNVIKRIFVLIQIATCLCVGIGLARALTPPAVVHVCGKDGNGLTVLHRNVSHTQADLFAQGCNYEDQKVIVLDATYSFVYGTKVLIGENR